MELWTASKLEREYVKALQPTRLSHPWDSPGKNTGVGCHFLFQCTEVKSESEVAQSCPTLRDPMDCSLPGSSVHGIFQARVLEWSTIVLRNLFAGQEATVITRHGTMDWFQIGGKNTGVDCHFPGDLPDPGIEPVSLLSAALADRFFTTSATWEAL